MAEVFHARYTEHAYPSHTHDVWTLLIVDDGMIGYGLEHDEHDSTPNTVTLLPPHVAHDGRTVTSQGFRKRVLYLDDTVLGDELVGAAVDRPTLADPLLRRRVDQLHHVLTHPGEALAGESRLALVGEALRDRLGRAEHPRPPDDGVADALRQLLDEHVVDGITLADAAGSLDTHPTHLVRSFGRAYGLPPHRYLTGRRVELARRLLLAGQPAADVAITAGFYDQSHLNRHFTRMLGTTPARYAGLAR